MTYTPTSVSSNYKFGVTYSGDTNYAAISTQVPVALTVSQATATVGAAAFSPSSPITLSNSVTVSTSVNGPGGGVTTPTGNVQFKVSINGGSYSSFGSSTLSGSSASISYTPQTATSYKFEAVYQGDTNYVSGTTGGASGTLTVNSAPIVSISPTSVSMDIGQSLLFTASASGGTGTLSYQWYLDGSLTGTNSESYSYTSGTSHSVTCKVTDSASTPVTSPASNSVSVTVNSAPSISTQPSSATIDSGQSVTLSSTATGGTGSFSWQWYNHAGTQVSSGSGTGTFATHSFSAVDSGYYLVFTDTGVTSGASPAATATSSGASVTVNADPTVTVSPATVTMDVGQPQTFTANPTGGSGTYPASGYQWYVGGVSLGSSQTAKTFSYTAGSAGSPLITVTVTDSLGWTSSQSVAPSITVNQLTISPSAGSNGEISPSTVQNVNYGATPSFTITPSPGYHILDVQVDSVSVLADMVDNVYTFPAVFADHSITATFASDAINTRLTVAISPTTFDKNDPNQETITISGTLTDMSSNPLTGQTITLWCNDGHDWVQIDPTSTVTTITGGAYSYAWQDCPTTLPNGYYVIEARFAQNDPYQSSYADTNTTGNGSNLNVLPEYAIGALAALGACLAGFVVFKKRSSLPRLRLHV